MDWSIKFDVYGCSWIDCEWPFLLWLDYVDMVIYILWTVEVSDHLRNHWLSQLNLISMVVAELIVSDLFVMIGLQWHMFCILSTIVVLDLPRCQCVSIFNLMSMVVAELIVINFSGVIGLRCHVFPILWTMAVLDLPRCQCVSLFKWCLWLCLSRPWVTFLLWLDCSVVCFQFFEQCWCWIFSYVKVSVYLIWCLWV